MRLELFNDAYDSINTLVILDKISHNPLDELHHKIDVRSPEEVPIDCGNENNFWIKQLARLDWLRHSSSETLRYFTNTLSLSFRAFFPSRSRSQISAMVQSSGVCREISTEEV